MYTFSPIQQKIIKKIMLGHTNKQIAYELHLSPNKVKYEIGLLYKILGVKKREELILKVSFELKKEILC
jgi:DNA-binding CsgD family transcriptional regulator